MKHPLKTAALAVSLTAFGLLATVSSARALPVVVPDPVVVAATVLIKKCKVEGKLFRKPRFVCRWHRR
jgi:ABC-type spermidine/putrescine transport system permease subunit II